MLWTRLLKPETSDQQPDRTDNAYGRRLRCYLAQRCPDEDDLQYCERRAAEEERLALSAGSPEAGAIHEQTAMLYRAQEAALRKVRRKASATARQLA